MRAGFIASSDGGAERRRRGSRGGFSVAATLAIEPLHGGRQPRDGGLDRFQIGVDPRGIVAAPHVPALELDPAHQDRQRRAQVMHQHRPLLLLLGPRPELWRCLVHG
jgi:hypothetical protein